MGAIHPPKEVKEPIGDSALPQEKAYQKNGYVKQLIV